MNKVLVRAPGHWLFVGTRADSPEGTIRLEDASNIRTYSGSLAAVVVSRETCKLDKVGTVTLDRGPGVFAIDLPANW